MKSLLQALAICCVALSLGPAQATLIIDTTPANNQANMSAQAGQTFTTGTLGTNNRLDSITVITANTIGGSDPVGPFTLNLYTNNNAFTSWAPGSLIAASTNTASLSPAGNASITFNFGLESLSDNTVYALSFSNGSGDHVGFRAGLTNAAGVVLTDGALFSGGTQPFSGAYDLSFQVNAVPEPAVSTLVLLPLAAGAAALLSRRRASRTLA